MEANKDIGIKGEHEFIKRLNQSGIPYEFVDDWYDFNIYGVKVEVKTTRLSHKFTNKKQITRGYKIGRFDFTERQREEELYTAFFIRHRDEYLFMGITLIKKGSPRYISIHKLRDYSLMDLKEFIDKIYPSRSK